MTSNRHLAGVNLSEDITSVNVNISPKMQLSMSHTWAIVLSVICKLCAQLYSHIVDKFKIHFKVIAYF